MTQALNNEEINEIVENFSGEERVDFLSKDKENWKNFKQNSPLFVENSPSVDVLYSNPLYTQRLSTTKKRCMNKTEHLKL
jgi:hypothetical protein